MLINTNQLISLVDLRTKAGQFVTKAKTGAVFYITDKGTLMAQLSAIQTDRTKTRDEVFARMDSLRKRAAKLKFTDNRDSTEIIREMRDQRTAYLLKRDGSSH